MRDENALNRKWEPHYFTVNHEIGKPWEIYGYALTRDSSKSLLHERSHHCPTPLAGPAATKYAGVTCGHPHKSTAAQIIEQVTHRLNTNKKH